MHLDKELQILLSYNAYSTYDCIKISKHGDISAIFGTNKLKSTNIVMLQMGIRHSVINIFSKKRFGILKSFNWLKQISIVSYRSADIIVQEYENQYIFATMKII